MSRGKKSSRGARADDLIIAMGWSNDERLRDLTVVVAPHCHGSVCVLDPVTLTAWVSEEYDVVTQTRALCAAVEQLAAAKRRRVLHLVPDVDDDLLVQAPRSS